MDKVLQWFAEVSTANPIKIITASVAIFILFTAFLFKLQFSLNLIKYYPEEMDIRKASELVDSSLT